MAYEYNDKKYKTTLCIVKLETGKYKLSGFVRICDANGDTTLRLTTAVDNSVEFDGVEFIPEQPPANTEIGLTLFRDWGVGIV